MRLNRKDNTAGIYHTNQFCITLPPMTTMFDESGLIFNALQTISDKKTYSSFVHEYFHYVHNLSTVSGFMTFLIFQSLLSEFWKCLREDGSSKGSNDFSDDDNRIFRELINELTFYNGDVEPIGITADDNIVEMNVINITETSKARKIYGKDIIRDIIIIKFHVKFDTGQTKDIDFQLGDAAIDEGLAYEIDRFVAAEIDDKGRSSITDDAPPFPYSVLRILSEHLVPSGMPIISRLACAKLSLLSVNPAKMLIMLLKDYEKIKGVDGFDKENQILSKLWANAQEGATQAINTIINTEIPGFLEMHEGRGIIEDSIKALSDLYKKLLQARLKDPFYDLKPFDKNNCDIPQLTAFMKNVAPCSVIQQRKGCHSKLERDILLSFTPEYRSPKGYSLNNVLSPLHAQMHFLLQHLSISNFEESVRHRRNCCPFYTSCNLPNRKKKASLCLREPWKTYKSKNDNCWYGTAVASTLGKTQVLSIKNQM